MDLKYWKCEMVSKPDQNKMSYGYRRGLRFDDEKHDIKEAVSDDSDGDKETQHVLIGTSDKLWEI